MNKVIHICAVNSLRAGVDLPPMDCSHCGKKTLYADWVSSHCDTCGFDTERYTGENLRVIREKMQLSRKQLGEILGYSAKTIKKYEWTNPSKIYWNKFKYFTTKFFDNKDGK